MLALVAAVSAGDAAGQQTALSGAAVQPGKGVVVARGIAEATLYEGDAIGFDELVEYRQQVVAGYGLTRDVTAMVHVPLVYRDYQGPVAAGTGDSFTDVFGIDDVLLMGQYRFWQNDTGAIDTRRAVVSGGVEVPTFAEGLSSDSFDPFVGAAYTQIQGRHGVNAAARYKLTTGGGARSVRFGQNTGDALRVDAGYLYRLSPAQYGLDTTHSTYLTFDVLGRYETNGDTELLLAPGYLWEGPRSAVFGGVMLPVHQDLDLRAEAKVGVVLEVRLLF
ncbi:MAG: hypothetical protein AAGA57_12435 [Planctomycetota bacterium]